MKKYNLLYILTAGMMLFSSCEDFLNTDSPSEQSKENLFENEGMTRSAIMGVYSELAGTYVYGQKMSVNRQAVIRKTRLQIRRVTPVRPITGVTGIIKRCNGDISLKWQNLPVRQ